MDHFVSHQELTPFPIDRIVDFSTTDFDLFLPIDGQYILYGGSGYQWQRSELRGLLKNGFNQFFIRRTDANKAAMYEKVVQLPTIERDLAPKDRIQSIEDVGAAFLKCLYAGEITEACVHKARHIGDAIVDCVREDPTCVKSLKALSDHDAYTYHHSIRVSTFASGIALQMGGDYEKVLRDLAVGCVFHDIGKRAIPESVLNKSGALTDQEWDMMRSHPETGFLDVSDSLLGHIPREVILHHHEKLDGSGYPHQLEANSLMTEVQIATLADVFDAITSVRAYQQKRSRYEALDFIKHKLLKSRQVSSDAFRAMVECLAV